MLNRHGVYDVVTDYAEKLVSIIRHSFDAVKEEIMRFIEERVPYE